MKFSIKNFFRKYDEILSFLQIHLLDKSLMKTFISCAAIMGIGMNEYRSNTPKRLNFTKSRTEKSEIKKIAKEIEGWRFSRQLISNAAVSFISGATTEGIVYYMKGFITDSSWILETKSKL